MRLWRWAKKNWLLFAVLAAYALVTSLDAPEGVRALRNAALTFGNVAATLTTVFIFVGLFQVWVREEFILRHLGEDSGIKGLFFGALLGTAIHGPLVAVFPMLKALREKGARLGVLVAIVSTWSIKVPMIPLEFRYFGWKFTILRQILLFASAFIMAPAMERLLAERSDRAAVEVEDAEA